MSISLGLNLNLGGPRGYGAVVPDPARLLTFTAARGNVPPINPPIGGVLRGTSGSLVSPDVYLQQAAAGILNSVQPAVPRYRFRINPNKLSVSREKLESYKLSKFGYERQSWGNGLTTFRYSGSTGVFRPDGLAPITINLNLFGPTQNTFDVTTTLAWKSFQAFDDFYLRSGGTNIFMYYWAYPHEYEGSLSDFSFEQSADKPFSIDYSFKFTALPIDYPPTGVSLIASPSSVPGQQQAAASTPSIAGASGPTGFGP